jgi:hypothetical protein
LVALAWVPLTVKSKIHDRIFDRSSIVPRGDKVFSSWIRTRQKSRALSYFLHPPREKIIEKFIERVRRRAEGREIVGRRYETIDTLQPGET